MNGDGAIFKLARFGASSHSGLMHLCRSTAGQCPTLRKIHKPDEVEPRFELPEEHGDFARSQTNTDR